MLLYVASLLKICLSTGEICLQYFTQYTFILTIFLFLILCPVVIFMDTVVDIAGLYRTCWTFNTVIYTFYGKIYLVYLDRKVSFLHCKNRISCLLLSFHSCYRWIEYCLKTKGKEGRIRVRETYLLPYALSILWLSENMYLLQLSKPHWSPKAVHKLLRS
jgi:hypothetical protein